MHIWADPFLLDESVHAHFFLKSTSKDDSENLKNANFLVIFVSQLLIT